MKIVGTDVELSVGHQKDRKMEQEKKADVEATYNTTGWKPQIGLNDGLSKTVDWYRNQRKPAFH